MDETTAWENLLKAEQTSETATKMLFFFLSFIYLLLQRNTFHKDNNPKHAASAMMECLRSQYIHVLQ